MVKLLIKPREHDTNDYQDQGAANGPDQSLVFSLFSQLGVFPYRFFLTVTPASALAPPFLREHLG